MPPGSEGTGSMALPEPGGADRFRALSKEALQRILFFLPSREAVQTLLLSRQWSDIWKDVRSLRITDADEYGNANEMNYFVNMFLLFRNPEPLHVVDIISYSDGDPEDTIRYLQLWVRYCMECKAQILKVHNNLRNVFWRLDQVFLSSKYLRVLDLSYVNIIGVLNSSKLSCLDFSSCEALEGLMMNNCGIGGDLFMIFPSLKGLTLNCCYFSRGARTQISAPKLVFLILASCEGRTPILEKMPWLVSAFVRLQADMDRCCNKYETGDCHLCAGCRDCIIKKNTSVLLEGLSNATHLELTSIQTEFIFRKDLTQCPLFSKLKTLLLNDWCVTRSLDALRCLLQHCPILEKLTLQFPNKHVFSDKILEDLVDNGVVYNMAKEPILLKYLKVEVIRPEEIELDVIICKIKELLYSFGVCSEQIKIQQLPHLSELENKYEDFDGYNENFEPWPSACFSFEQQTQLDSL